MFNFKFYKKIKIVILCLLSTGLFMSNLYAQYSPLGCWKTVDDQSGDDKSYVEITQTQKNIDGETKTVLSAKVAKILKLDDPSEDPETKVCKVCEGAKHNQKIKGMEIMWGVENTGETSWDNGEILDPKTGKVYNVSLAQESARKLQVRGYLGISLLGRTQTWRKVEDSLCN